MTKTLYKSRLRDLKQRARTGLHHAMEVPAYYYDPKTRLPYFLTVRVHTKWDAKGEVQGTSFRFAESREETPKLIFLREQFKPLGIEPARLGVVMISAEEGYRLDNAEDPYLQTITWHVVPLSDKDLRAYPSPMDGIIANGAIELPGLGGAPEEYLPAIDVSGTAIMYLIGVGVIDLPFVE